MNHTDKELLSGSTQLRSKIQWLTGGLLALAVTIGSVSVFQVRGIDASVDRLTRIVLPLSSNGSELVREVSRTQGMIIEKVSHDLLSELPEEHSRHVEDVRRALTTFLEQIDHHLDVLKNLVGQGNLVADIEALFSHKKTFFDTAGKLLQLHEESVVRAHEVQASVVQILDKASQIEHDVDALSRFSRETMSEEEDASKTLSQAGDATLEDHNRLLDEIFNQTYPLIRWTASGT